MLPLCYNVVKQVCYVHIGSTYIRQYIVYNWVFCPRLELLSIDVHKCLTEIGLPHTRAKPSATTILYQTMVNVVLVREISSMKKVRSCDNTVPPYL